MKRKRHSVGQIVEAVKQHGRVLATLAGQPLGDCLVTARQAVEQSECSMGCVLQTGGATGCAYPRPAPQFRFEGTCLGRESDHGREAARALARADHGSLRPPCARVGEDVGRQSRGEHCG